MSKNSKSGDDDDNDQHTDKAFIKFILLYYYIDF